MKYVIVVEYTMLTMGIHMCVKIPFVNEPEDEHKFIFVNAHVDVLPLFIRQISLRVGLGHRLLTRPYLPSSNHELISKRLNLL